MSQLQSADFQELASVQLVGSTETLVGVSVPCVVESPTCKCSIKVWLIVNPGAAAGAFTVKIYRGKDLNGALVATSNGMLALVSTGQLGVVAFATSDSLSNAGQAQYCVSVTQLAATGNGTMTQGVIETMVLSG